MLESFCTRKWTDAMPDYAVTGSVGTEPNLSGYR